jgi:hypothetical protein
MTVTTNGVYPLDSSAEVHYLELGRNIPGTTEWPEYLVLYADEYLRLIPFPPEGSTNVRYGSSVIVGPAQIANRPYADIAAVDYRPASQTFLVTYRAGGTALLDAGSVSRTSALVAVTVDFRTDQPFCTLRSMFVFEGNADVDHVDWMDLSGALHSDPIRGFSGIVGTEWFFNRKSSSVHNPSAPDIRILFK